MLHQHCFCEAVDLSWDIVGWGRRKRHFRRKQRLGTQRWAHPITKAEVTMVGRKLHGGKAPGVDKIHTEVTGWAVTVMAAMTL